MVIYSHMFGFTLSNQVPLRMLTCSYNVFLQFLDVYEAAARPFGKLRFPKFRLDTCLGNFILVRLNPSTVCLISMEFE